jgi:3-hydroxyisobutyrate dehydrogenase-like beta-hydroxyacid dehydrogenase
MAKPAPDIVFIGFGEAAMAFAVDLPGSMAGYDLRLGEAAKRRDFERCGVRAAASNANAVARASLIVSLVTADQALAAARETAAALCPGALYCDLNSVTPDTKRDARAVIESAGGRYADIAVMAPVLPARRDVPMLASGPHADAACAALTTVGFRARSIAGDVGAATAVKMIRSVLVKGLEALTAECFLAAEAAGVTGEVAASLDASWPGTDWTAKTDYNLERMLVHGLRRAAEMQEVVNTLDALGTGSAMARATAKWQRAIGERRLPPPAGLSAKAAALLGREEIAA